MNRVVLFELNEFNFDLLATASQELNLPNLKRLSSLNRSQTTTDDTYESDFLEPWVQWVSVHSGIPSSQHKIKHLGDVPDLKTKQLWETLSEMGVSSGIWCAMNASRGTAEKNLFFLPDPWTASERAYPEELNDLLDPLRYLSKNYLNFSFRTAFQKVKNLLKLIGRNRVGGKLIRKLPKLISHLIRFRGENFPLISFFDYASMLLFLEYRKRWNPDFSLVFVNSLAHLQHHHWKGFDYASNARLKYGLYFLELAVEELFKHLQPSDILLVTNALSQKNTNEETPWILYRQNDPSGFLHAIGLTPSRVEPHMTHDAHLYFATPAACQAAKALLESAEIKGRKLFLIEAYLEEPLKLFYRVSFTDEVSSDTTFSVGEKSFRFFDLFTPIVERTGKHIPTGTLLSNRSNLPSTLSNHEIYHTIVKLYQSQAPTLAHKR